MAPNGTVRRWTASAWVTIASLRAYSSWVGVSGAYSVAGSAIERQGRRRAELDARLERLIRMPAVFAAEFAAKTVAEQEIWLEALAEHARWLGRDDEVVRELQLGGHPRALELATAFATELQRTEAEQRREVASLSAER